ncbi:MAG: GPW/gp25 family protein [Pseudomonadales bacterium]|nr:GPW/gp25 family protein [Pseudomonadales bacterium]
MNAQTGKLIDGVEELRQSVRDILSTPIGARVMTRDYGSGLFDLIDDPVDQRFSVEVFRAVAEAVRRWEPRFLIDRVKLTEVRDTGPIFELHGTDLDTGVGVVLEGI